MARPTQAGRIRLRSNEPLPVEDMARLRSTLKKARKRFHHHGAHVYVGPPSDPKDEHPVIRVYRADVGGKKIRSRIDGVKVEVFPFARRPVNPRATRSPRLLGGIQTGNETKPSTPGTLGAIVFDDRWNPMALSNYHVYVESRPNGARGDPVSQPARLPEPLPRVSRADRNNRIGTVAGSDELLDCAVARLDDRRPFSTSILGIPGGIKGIVDPAIGMIVRKSGVGSNVTRGMIENVSDDCFTIVPFPGQWMDLSTRGDSGSVWLEEESHAAVGLHHSGEASNAREDERAYAIPMRAVVEKLGIKLCRKQEYPWTSATGPAVVSLRDRLLLGWVDRGNFTLRFAWATLHKKLRIEHIVSRTARSGQSVSLCHFRRRYYCAFVGVRGDRLYIMRSENGKEWEEPRIVAQSEASSPALAVVRDRLLLGWHGTDNKLQLMSTGNGLHWSPKNLPTLYTASGPALAAFQSRVVMAWEGAPDHRLNVALGDSILRLPYKTDAKPCLHVHEGRLYLAWRGADGEHRLHISSSRDGRVWTSPIVLRESSIGGPALGSLNEGGDLRHNLVWCWTDGDERKKRAQRGGLNTLLYDLWQPPVQHDEG